MFSKKISIFLCLFVVIVSARPPPPPGGVNEADTATAERILHRSLTKLASGDGPYYSIGRIHSATEQVVQGLLTKIEADLVERNGNTKRCNITIWSREWLPNGIEISFECPNEAKVTRKHNA